MTYEQLKALVAKHCTLYYDRAAPEISDAEFDNLYDQLLKVEKEQGWADTDSPTTRVGGAPGKYTHPYKLYSLRKVYDKEEIDSFYDVETPKIDGTNLTLIYRRGKLVLALTRGNGEQGDNVLHLAKKISNIPLKINTELEHFVINGECVTDNTVENFRNYVSGALGLKSSEEFETRNIKFIAHDVLGVVLNYKTRMSVAKNMGFTTVFCTEAAKYPHDGVVYRIDSYSKSIELGYTAKYPKFAVALKPRGELLATATLQDVVWAIGRTGTVNPTGIISPVIIDDAKISRVTLHNIGIIEEHKLGLGDVIEIERAGGVIPKFTRVIEHSSHNIKITQQHAETALNAKMYREGPKLFVVNKELASATKAIEYFVKVMDIKGLGPASIKKLSLNTINDIYTTNKWDELGANGAKVKEEVIRSLRKPYSVVLAALGIPGVGPSTAKLIVTYIPKFSNLRDIAYKDIKGVGPSTIESILDWLEENEYWVEKLPLSLEQLVQVNDLIGGDTFKKVCITGKLDMSRGDLEDLLSKKGFKVTSTVTKDCYALITGGDTTSSKYKKAVDLKVNIVDYWSNKKEVLAGDF